MVRGFVEGGQGAELIGSAPPTIALTQGPLNVPRLPVKSAEFKLVPPFTVLSVEHPGHPATWAMVPVPGQLGGLWSRGQVVDPAPSHFGPKPAPELLLGPPRQTR